MMVNLSGQYRQSVLSGFRFALFSLAFFFATGLATFSALANIGTETPVALGTIDKPVSLSPYLTPFPQQREHRLTAIPKAICGISLI